MYNYHTQPNWKLTDCAELQEFVQMERAVNDGIISEEEAKERFDEIIEIVGEYPGEYEIDENGDLLIEEI